MTRHAQAGPGSSERRGREIVLNELLKPSQVCKRLNVSRTWLFDATREGRIPSVRLGEEGPVRYHPAELDAWLQRRGKGLLKRAS